QGKHPGGWRVAGADFVRRAGGQRADLLLSNSTVVSELADRYITAVSGEYCHDPPAHRDEPAQSRAHHRALSWPRALGLLGVATHPNRRDTRSLGEPSHRLH